MKLTDAILVTGGAGFIGSNFVRHWISTQKTTLINLDKLTYAGNLVSLADLKSNPLHIFVEGDITDEQLIKKLLEQYRPRALINFAAESHVDRSITGPQEFIQTNIVGTFTLLEQTRLYWSSLEKSEQQQFRFLHVSTDEVYGSLSATEPAFTETHAYEPNSPYSASKASADHLVRAYFHTYGLPTLTTNCSNNYGPYQFPEKFIPVMIQQALQGKALPVYGDGKNIRDWLYVQDHCEALCATLARGKVGDTYNIGGNCEKENVMVVHELCAVLDEIHPQSAFCPHKSLIKFVTDRPGHDRRYAIDSSKIKRELGWQPRENFISGLRKTVEWYVQNQAWVSTVLK